MSGYPIHTFGGGVARCTLTATPQRKAQMSQPPEVDDGVKPKIMRVDVVERP